MASELVWRLTGGAYSTDPLESLGGERSVWQVSIEGLFDDVSSREASLGDVEYRAIDLLNTGNQGARNIRLRTYPADSIAVGLSGTADMAIWDDHRKPNDHGSFVSFAYRTQANPLEIPDIAPGSAARVWLRRTISPKSPGRYDTETLHLTYQ